MSPKLVDISARRPTPGFVILSAEDVFLLDANLTKLYFF
jgi:hypothetical protein